MILMESVFWLGAAVGIVVSIGVDYWRNPPLLAAASLVGAVPTPAAGTQKGDVLTYTLYCDHAPVGAVGASQLPALLLGLDLREPATQEAFTQGLANVRRDEKTYSLAVQSPSV